MARLPQVSGRRLVQALEKLGWQVHHYSGSHAVLKHPLHPDIRVTATDRSRREFSPGFSRT